MDRFNHLNLAWVPLIVLAGSALGTGLGWLATRRRP
jgi:hypothetical protein